ncbi:MAG: hypothetical protein ABUL72_07225 [Armatimonadota bacterium]
MQDHIGRPLSEDLDFFVPAPASIGTVRSQFSTLKKGDKGTVSKNHVMIAVAFVAAAVVCGVIYYATKNVFALAFGLLFAAFAGLRALNTKRFECNYVGDKGVARYRIGKDDQNKSSLEGGVFLFESAENFYTNVIETAGIWPFYGQNAIYQWVATGTKAKFSIFTDQYNPAHKIEGDELVCFLRAAEEAWTQFQLEKARANLAAYGAMEFPYRLGGKVTLTSGGMRVEIKGFVDMGGSDLLAIVHRAGSLDFITTSGEVKASCDCFHLSNILVLETLVCEQFGLTRTDSGVVRVSEAAQV